MSPSLTHAIQSVEKEVGFRIFDRGRSGVTVTEQGEELLSDIRTIYEQMAAVQSKYIEKRPERKTFSVSIQHFSPAGEAAMRLLSRLEEESYIVKFLEGKTTEVIADVASGRSEIGFLHFPDEKEPGILRDLRNEKIEFYSIGTAKPCLLLRKDHPLAALPMVSLQELSPYPLVSYDYGVDGSVYVSEEGVTMLQTDRQVAVSDGLMLTNVLVSTDTCAVAMPYLGDVERTDPIYENTRRFVWSTENPYFWRGAAGEGIGGPHIGVEMIWPMSIMMRAFTATDDEEIRDCICQLITTDAGTGFMHESFSRHDAADFTRAWFAWQNTLFGELILKLVNDGKTDLLNSIR